MSEIEPTVKMATDIVVALVSTQTVDPNQVPNLVREIRAALNEDLAADDRATPSRHDQREVAAVVTTTAPKPPVPIDQSVTAEYVICLEDGKPFRSLKRHLMAKYGLTPEAYRKKWHLPDDYPMVAPDYAKARSAVAKRIKLGGRRTGAGGEATKTARRKAR